MPTLPLNNKLTVEYPDSFHVMTKEEWSRLSLLQDGEGVGLSDPDRHILITCGWKQLNLVTSMLLSAKDVAKNMEKQIMQAIKPFGCHAAEHKELPAAGTTACGFSYEYQALEIDMYAESYAMKIDKCIYYLHFYARAAMKNESIAVWKQILGSLR